MTPTRHQMITGDYASSGNFHGEYDRMLERFADEIAGEAHWSNPSNLCKRDEDFRVYQTTRVVAPR